MKLAELRKADRPSLLVQRARAGQPRSGGAAVSEKNHPPQVFSNTRSQLPWHSFASNASS